MYLWLVDYLPLCYVRMTVELSYIGPDGVCMIYGVDIGSSEIKMIILLVPHQYLYLEEITV